MFAYYPLPGGGAEGGALSITTNPPLVEFYEPHVFGRVSFPLETQVTGGTGPYTITWAITSLAGADLYLDTFTGPTNIVYGENPSGAPGTKEGDITVTVKDATAATASYVCPVKLGFGVNPE